MYICMVNVLGHLEDTLSKFPCHSQEAAQRRIDFDIGLYVDPVYFGQFPDSVRARVPYLPEIPDDLVLSS